MSPKRIDGKLDGDGRTHHRDVPEEFVVVVRRTCGSRKGEVANMHHHGYGRGASSNFRVPARTDRTAQTRCHDTRGRLFVMNAAF